MKILVLAPSYPYANRPFASFNERSVAAMRELCESVEVLAPRPYAPPLLSSLAPRWKSYAQIAAHEIRNGVPVHRPAYPQIPRFGGAFWFDLGAFLWCRRTAKRMHDRVNFDAIISFDLLGTGGIAWRMKRYLGIPASGWATGDDVRVPASSSYGRAVIRAINRLDVVFYQSHELLKKACSLLGIFQMSREHHIVLPRGIPTPPSLPRTEIRKRVRAECGIADNQFLVLSTGRIFREKGIFELLDAVSWAATRDSSIVWLLVGSDPSFDETAALRNKLNQLAGIKHQVRILPACSSDKIWEYLCAADMFAFASHNEGMPNSLLEAMGMGVPAIAFGIPAVQELEAGMGAPLIIPTFDSVLFGQAILRLAARPEDRARIGEKGRDRVMNRFMIKTNMGLALSRLAAIVQQRYASGPGFHPEPAPVRKQLQ